MVSVREISKLKFGREVYHVINNGSFMIRNCLTAYFSQIKVRKSKHICSFLDVLGYVVRTHVVIFRYILVK